MAFFDKLKDTVNNAAQMAKEQYDSAVQQYNDKVAVQETHKQEMLEKANAYANDIISKIEANYNENTVGYFAENSVDTVVKYTTEFFEKLYLPANGYKDKKIFMYPYIEQSQLKKFAKDFGVEVSGNDAFVLITDKSKQLYLLTYDKFYFKTALPEDPAFLLLEVYPVRKSACFHCKRKREVISFFAMTC